MPKKKTTANHTATQISLLDPLGVAASPSAAPAAKTADSRPKRHRAYCVMGDGDLAVAGSCFCAYHKDCNDKDVRRGRDD